MKKTLLPLLLFCCSLACAQKSRITGRIAEDLTRYPVAGAFVQVRETNFSTITGESGDFMLLNVPEGAFTLVVSSIGFERMEASVTPGEKDISLYLKRSDIKLEEIMVTAGSMPGRDLINGIDLRLRPLTNSQEVLRMIPGLFIGQHAGGGKAEQIFLRGFDIDHGTDLRLSVDGLPVNMVSHAHGQGYADLHFVIPELVENVYFGKGPYEAAEGNFSTAGWVDFRTKDVLDQNLVKTEAGQFNTYRVLTAFNLLGNPREGKQQSAYAAGEYNYSDSYFDSPQDFNRLNALVRYQAKIGRSQLKASASTFASGWSHSGQIPDRAVHSGTISFFGAIDDTEGGRTSRSNLQASLLTPLGGGLLTHQLYYTRYRFDLYSNFTFFLEDPENGDQIRQKENRHLFGYNGSFRKESLAGTLPVSTKAGISYRHDLMAGTELSHTLNRQEVLTPLMLGDIAEVNAGIYLDEELRFSSRWTAVFGVRYDIFRNSYRDQRSGDWSGRRVTGILSPKFSLNHSPATNLQLFFRSGKSFHSNDSRVVVTEKNRQVLPPAYGADLGVNWKPLPRLFLSAAGWYLWLDQEFVYVGDAGVVEPSGKTRRMGLDFSARYQLGSKLYADLDFNTTRPRPLEAPEDERYIPLAPVMTSAGGLTYRAGSGLNGSVRYRYMADRPATGDGSLTAQGYFLTDLQLNYTRPRYSIGLSVNNLLNTRWKETQFATESRLKDELLPVEEIHFTAGSPFFGRLSLSLFW